MKIPFEQLNKIFITSDTHFHHKNICRGVSEWSMENRTSAEGNILGVRDFDTLEAMDAALVENINSIVPEDGILFHLGDWSFGGEPQIEIFRNQLKVKEIHLITGNHDHHQEAGKWDHLFTSRQKYLELFVGKICFCLFHFPIKSWNHVNKGAFHLHGHQHWKGEMKFGEGRMMDVGVDGNDLKPWKLTDVVDFLKDRRKYDKDDHHTW